jgi:hypothetical protein
MAKKAKRKNTDEEFLRIVRAAVVLGDRRETHIRVMKRLVKIIDKKGKQK